MEKLDFSTLSDLVRKEPSKFKTAVDECLEAFPNYCPKKLRKTYAQTLDILSSAGTKPYPVKDVCDCIEILDIVAKGLSPDAAFAGFNSVAKHLKETKTIRRRRIL